MAKSRFEAWAVWAVNTGVVQSFDSKDEAKDCKARLELSEPQPAEGGREFLVVKISES